NAVPVKGPCEIVVPIRIPLRIKIALRLTTCRAGCCSPIGLPLMVTCLMPRILVGSPDVEKRRRRTTVGRRCSFVKSADSADELNPKPGGFRSGKGAPPLWETPKD